jgi:hypothetical protein
MTYYTAGKYTLCYRVAGWGRVGWRENTHDWIRGTHVAQACIYNTMHFGDSPFHYVAEALVVDVEVLSAHRPLSAFFEFVLTVAVGQQIGRLIRKPFASSV